jgi:tetratricopeptide (TPR) repeat protein
MQPGTHPIPAGRRVSFAGAALLVTLVLVAYLPVQDAGFVWDDDMYVVDNPNLRDLDGLQRIWFEPRASPQYYPLVHTTFWIEHRLVGLAPQLYHLDNVLLHAANAVLLWRLLLMVGVPGAWLVAAVFALHPVQVESVAWVTERKNLLSALFYLASGYAYLRTAGRARDDGPGRANQALAWLLYLCALLSKSVTASLPAALALVLWWRHGRLSRRDLATLAPMLVVGAAFGMFTAWLEREHVMAQGPEWAFSAIERCLIAGRALWFYAAKLVWPDPISFIYPRWEIDAGAWWQLAYPLAAAGVVIALATWRRRLGTGPLVGVLFYAGTLFPALGFVNVYPMRYSFVANHFQYLACIGLIALLVAGASRLADRLGLTPRTAGILAAGPLLVLAGLSWRTTLAYADIEALWRDTLEKNQGAWMAHNNLGLVLDARGRHAEARQHFRATLRLAPWHAKARHSLGRSLAGAGRFDEAVEELERTVALAPDEPRYRASLGEAYLRQGDFAAAERTLRALVAARFGGAPAHRILALALLGQGRDAEALRLDPEFAAAASDLLRIEGNSR